MPEDQDAPPATEQPAQQPPAPVPDDEKAKAGASDEGAWEPLAVPGKPDGEVDTRP